MQNIDMLIKYLEILSEAIKRFYLNDAKSLFGKNKQIDERAMVGCIYRYMWYMLEQQAIKDVQLCDIDVEYDRMEGTHGKEIRKHISIMDCCSLCKYKESCVEVIKKHMKENNYDFRPDIILHARGVSSQAGNFLDIEIKKENAVIERKNFDEAKVRYCICAKAPLRYKIGVIVLLSEKGASMKVYTHNGEDFIVESKLVSQ